MTDEWDRKDLWRKHGKDFVIEISRHSVKPSGFDFGKGEHRWAVYAYIYPEHPHFAAFDGVKMWQPAASMLPLHGGPSFLRRHTDDDGKVTSYQVGADYDHLRDDRFSDCATQKDAWEVFSDAEDLHKWLSSSTKLREQQ